MEPKASFPSIGEPVKILAGKYTDTIGTVTHEDPSQETCFTVEIETAGGPTYHSYTPYEIKGF